MPAKPLQLIITDGEFDHFSDLNPRDFSVVTAETGIPYFPLLVVGSPGRIVRGDTGLEQLALPRSYGEFLELLAWKPDIRTLLAPHSQLRRYGNALRQLVDTMPTKVGALYVNPSPDMVSGLYMPLRGYSEKEPPRINWNNMEMAVFMTSLMSSFDTMRAQETAPDAPKTPDTQIM